MHPQPPAGGGKGGARPGRESSSPAGGKAAAADGAAPASSLWGFSFGGLPWSAPQPQPQPHAPRPADAEAPRREGGAASARWYERAASSAAAGPLGSLGGWFASVLPDAHREERRQQGEEGAREQKAGAPRRSGERAAADVGGEGTIVDVEASELGAGPS